MRRRNITHLKSEQMDELEKEGIKLAFEASVEGAVLLENNGALPMKPCRVAVYGIGCRNTMVRGIGSGDVTYRYVVNMEQGLESEGFIITNKEWLDRFDEKYIKYRKMLFAGIERESMETGVDNLHVFYNRPHIIPVYQEISDEDISNSRTDTAIYVLSRKEGEGCDRRHVEGEYLLAREEQIQLKKIREKHKTFILLLNIGSPIDMNEILEIAPDAVLLMYQGGAEIGNAVAQILTGKKNPSGKLTSTWAANYWDYPNSAEFGANDNDVCNEVYREGVYIGYRYFDSFNVTPLYPFGYGKSYTEFSIAYREMTNTKNRITVNAVVKNTGITEGKEVVQLYVSLPEITIEQPMKQLCAYTKTKLLKPGECEVVQLTFYMEDLASFDKKESTYVLEKGDYYLQIGNSSLEVSVCGIVRLNQKVVTRKVQHLFQGQMEFEVLTSDNRKNKELDLEGKECEVCYVAAESIPISDEILYSDNHVNYFSGQIDPSDVNHGTGEDVFLEVPQKISLGMVRAGQYSIEQMVASMDEDELVHLVTGQEYVDPRYLIRSVSTHVPGAAGETTNYFDEVHSWREIPYTVLADGPAGLRLIPHVQVDEKDSFVFLNPLLAYENGEFVEDKEYLEKYENCYQYTTGLPNATQLACTWNKELLYKIGELVGKEMEKYDVDLWLAPGINLHRNPLCGRCFEYFSEDPYISAVTAIELINGVQSNFGKGATIKHMAACNQEAARTSHNSIVDERTMRDMYLKGFELVVKYAKPFAIMTALNCVNGPHGTNSRDLATYVARDEWGYDGVIMTDWNTTTPERGANTAECINSGNDLIMPGSETDILKLKAALHNENKLGDAITLGDLQYSAMNVLKYILRTGKEENLRSH